jgi:predicted GIY-YIG superfamily endonuclease
MNEDTMPGHATTPPAKTVGYIYALAENGAVKYIGQAKNLNKRYNQHCSLAQNMGKTKKNEWIRKLLKAGQLPELIELEATDNLDECEIKWIKKYQYDGVELVNMADGGKTMKHLHRAKKNKPWGSKHSPTQHILMRLKQDIRTVKRFGHLEEAQKIEETYNYCVETIAKVGKDRMNQLLWEKHGDSY